tara:strand:- start:35 stop:841 length:807 start_codon:yes stop_codon:yes gene_type:complete
MGELHKGKSVIVTGAGSGIGKAIAERFADEGAQVAVNDIDFDSTNQVVKGIKDSEGVAIPAVADISKSDQVEKMFKNVIKDFGTVDVLINNAGLTSPMVHFLEASEDWWNQIIGVNLTGHFLCSKQAARIMAKNHQGVIINMSSGGATRAHRAFTAYDASKGGIEALTRAMAVDLGPYGIRVCALMPGSIDTEGMNSEARRLRGENIPLLRPGDPVDMAGPAVFLASEDASYITGEVLKVDGGMLAQQRSATVDIYPPDRFPEIETLN